MVTFYEQDQAGFHGRQRYRVGLGNMDAVHDDLLPRIRQNIKVAKERLLRMSPQARKFVLERALVQFERMPPGLHSMAMDIIRRESTRGAGKGYTPLGQADALMTAANTGSTLSSIANIVGTVGTLGLTVYGTMEAAKDRKAQQSLAQQQSQLETVMALSQLQTMQADSAMRRRQQEAELKAFQDQTAAEQAMREKMLAAPQNITSVAPMPGQTAPAPAKNNTKTLMIAGGAAAAGLLALSMMHK